jgi:signal transduction histidine kinase
VCRKFSGLVLREWPTLTSNVSERALILAPQGRDAFVAARILDEAGLTTDICDDLPKLVEEVTLGAGVAVLTDDTIQNADINHLVNWVGSQPPWSDFPFVLLTERGGGLERNPAAARQMEALGNVAFLERPFHPTTLVSVVQTAVRARRRQYEARSRLEELRATEIKLRAVNETLETRVAARTREIDAANRQLVSQIEERARVEGTLRQMQRLEAVGQLTSGVAHDFNNLLTVVLGNLQFIEKRGFGNSPDSILKQRLSHMRIAAERGAKLTSQLLAFSRRQHLDPKPVDLNDALGHMSDLLQSSLGGSVQIKTMFRPGLWRALVDSSQIELVVLNLAINARDASPVGSTITLETANATVGPPEKPEEPPAGEYVVVSITDKGSGMSKDLLAKAFEPFFTTKEIGKGSGLGLIKGAIILLVDDDEAVREVTATMLRTSGYVVLEVGSGGAALDLLDGETNIDLAIVDFAMPGMNGVEVTRQIHFRFPNLPVLFITGYVDQSVLAEIDEARIVKKPFVGEELATKVNVAILKAPRSRGKVLPLRR